MPAILRSILTPLVFLPIVCLPLDFLRGEGEDQELVAYRAGRIVNVEGDDVAPGILLVRGDKVEAVLPADGELAEGVELVDLGSSVVLPGLVNPLSSISQKSYRASGGGRASRRGNRPVDRRKSLALSRVDPRQPVYRRLGRTGYTSIAIIADDTGGLIEGRAAVIKPRKGAEKEALDLALVDKSYLFIGFESGEDWYTAAEKTIKAAVDQVVKERAEQKKAAEEAKKNAEEAKKKAIEEAKKKAEAGKQGKKEETEKTEDKPPPSKPPAPAPKTAPPPKAPETPPEKKEPDPLVQVFRGEVSVFLRAASPVALDHLFEFLDTLPLPLDFVLVTGPQPPEVIDKLAARRKHIRGVILDPSMGRLWETSIFVNSARLFLEHDFEVAFVPQRDDLEGFRAVFFHLGEMVRTGVRPREALRGVTSVPARFLGLEGRVGQFKKGADANFVVYDRDPLSGGARLLRVYLEGEEIFDDDPVTGRIRGEAVR